MLRKAQKEEKAPDLSLAASFKFFTLGVVGASFFMLEEEEEGKEEEEEEVEKGRGGRGCSLSKCTAHRGE